MNPRLLRPLASGFNPASINGIVHWWDANDASTLTLNSGAVETWTSKAGLMTEANQAVANNRPIQTTVNDKMALLFDGSNDGLDFTGVARTDETWVIACEQLSDQDLLRAIISDAASGFGINTNTSGAGLRQLNTSWGDFTNGSGRVLAVLGGVDDPLPASIFSVARSAATGISVRRNGTELGTGTTSGSVAMQAFGYFTSAAYQFNGWIGEIICYDRALDATELLLCERYLGTKWGVTTA